MKTILTAGILSLAFFSITMAKEKNGLIDSYKSAHSKNNKTLPFNYRYSQPIQMEVGKTYPLLVFFHGAGGRGNDNKGQLVDAGGIEAFKNQSKDTYPRIVSDYIAGMTDRFAIQLAATIV